MQYEFRAKTLKGAVRKSLTPQSRVLERKSSITIDAGRGDYSQDSISGFVEKGYRYTISWSARRPAPENYYAIDILSRHGNGSYREAFSSSGSWDFVARVTGEVEFIIRVARHFGHDVFRPYPVDIDLR